MATVKSAMVLKGLEPVWAVGSVTQLQKAVSNTLRLTRGEQVRVTGVSKLTEDATAASSLRRLFEWVNFGEKSLEKRRRLNAANSELKVDFVVTLLKDSPKNLIETKVMLLAAGGSAITNEFVSSLDSALLSDGMAAVNLSPSAITFVDPVYEDLSSGEEGTTTTEENQKQEASTQRAAFELSLLGFTLQLSTTQLAILLFCNLMLMLGLLCNSLFCKRAAENRKQKAAMRSRTNDSLDSSLDSEEMSKRGYIKKSKVNPMYLADVEAGEGNNNHTTVVTGTVAQDQDKFYYARNDRSFHVERDVTMKSEDNTQPEKEPELLSSAEAAAALHAEKSDDGTGEKKKTTKKRVSKNGKVRRNSKNKLEVPTDKDGDLQVSTDPSSWTTEYEIPTAVLTSSDVKKAKPNSHGLGGAFNAAPSQEMLESLKYKSKVGISPMNGAVVSPIAKGRVPAAPQAHQPGFKSKLGKPPTMEEAAKWDSAMDIELDEEFEA